MLRNTDKNMFLVGVRKNICTSPVLDHQVSVYNCKFLLEFFFLKDLQSFRVVVRGKGGGVNYFLQATCRLGLVQCFEIFHST